MLEAGESVEPGTAAAERAERQGSDAAQGLMTAADQARQVTAA